MIDQSESVQLAYVWWFLGGRGRDGFDTLVKGVQIFNKMAGVRLPSGSFQDQSVAFQV